MQRVSPSRFSAQARKNETWVGYCFFFSLFWFFFSLSRITYNYMSRSYSHSLARSFTHSLIHFLLLARTFVCSLIMKFLSLETYREHRLKRTIDDHKMRERDIYSRGNRATRWFVQDCVSFLYECVIIISVLRSSIGTLSTSLYVTTLGVLSYYS